MARRSDDGRNRSDLGVDRRRIARRFSPERLADPDGRRFRALRSHARVLGRHGENQTRRRFAPTRFLRRQLSLYLKLDITVRNFRDAANEREARITFVDPGASISVGELNLEEPPELEEAWDNLDVFPRHLIREIASIREGLRRLEGLMNGLPYDRQIVAGENGSQTRLDLVHEQIGSIVDSCAVIADGLAPEIERLAPFLPDQKRMLALYGEPLGD
jgi:hypothetical protein